MEKSGKNSISTPLIPKDSKFLSYVYEPAEDSYLLLDALEQELQVIGNQDSPLCLEVGCGSGILSTALVHTEQLRRTVPFVFAIDINPNACLLTKETDELNNGAGRIEALQANGENCSKLFNCTFDLIICNPPYVPTHDGTNEVTEEVNKSLVSSWDGGIDGNQFILPFLQNIPNLLSENGILYLLLSSWNNPEFLINEYIPKFQLKGDLVLKRTAGRERLSVWRITKVKDN